jgi:hypothetical protein
MQSFEFDRLEANKEEMCRLQVVLRFDNPFYLSPVRDQSSKGICKNVGYASTNRAHCHLIVGDPRLPLSGVRGMKLSSGRGFQNIRVVWKSDHLSDGRAGEQIAERQ